jgi:transcriptional antiterminator RfaH
VLHTKPHWEERVVWHVTRRASLEGIFLPKIEAIRRRRHRRWTVLEPLFPGYLFANLLLEPKTWNAVRWSPGIRSILGCGDVPVPVPQELVAAIQARVAEHGFARPGITLKPGDRVRFRDGPFAGLDAVFEKQLSRAGRVRVLLNLLSRLTPIDVGPLDLERV